MYTIEWKGSPNFTPGVRTSPEELCIPPLIVLHTMDGWMEGTMSWFHNPDSQVSSHYGVGRNGEIHQYVAETDGAWTNGRILNPSSSQIIERRGNPNTYTITIEYEGNDRGGALDEPQYQAGLWLIRDIAARWNIPLTRDYIIGHYEIDSVNKGDCPGPFFPWSRLMKDLGSQGPTVSVRRNGTPIALGFLEAGTTYVPIRKLAEALGYTVKWDEMDYIIDLIGDPN